MTKKRTTRKNEMIKTNFVIGLLALAFFTNAQYRGWNLFDSAASAQASRLSGNGARTYHTNRPAPGSQ